MSKTFLRAVGLLLLAATVRTASLRAGPQEAPWWNEQWPYRLILRVVPAARREGINTAQISLAEQSELCAQDGHDVRVVDDRGNPLPHRAEKDASGDIAVRFLVPAEAEVFYLYYGNHAAPPVEHAWEERLGGLTLETRATTSTEQRAGQIPALLAQSLRSFGKKPWGQINDMENPFGRSDLYLSIYEGTIWLPEDGRYAFAVNADDLASFHLLSGGLELLRCWRDAGVPSDRWRDPAHPNAVKTTGHLPRGIYWIRYYHVENGGAQLAKLGWQEPSSDTIVTVPPWAFPRYLPTEIEGRHKRGEELNPFFTFRHLYNLEVNREDLRFAMQRFESRSGEAAAEASGLSYTWDFGDGTTATGRSVDHEFPDLTPRTVTLTVRDTAGRQASVSRRVWHAAEPVKRMTLTMQLEFESEIPFLPPAGAAQVALLLKNTGSMRRPVVLQTLTEAQSNSARQQHLESEPIQNLEPTTDQQGGWLPLRKTVPLAQGNLYLTFRLLLHDRPVVEKALAALSTDRPLGELAQDPAHNLRDADGRLVVLRLADVGQQQAPQRALYDERTGQVLAIVIDEGLAGPATSDGDSDYVRVLASMLREKYPALGFAIRRPAIRLGEEYPPVGRFLETRRHTLAAQPHLVILVCQPESAVHTEPPIAFEGYLVAAVDQILSQSRAHVILVTPPPLPGRPDLARTYAHIAKKTGLRKGLIVADLYSRFLLTEGWPDLFKASGGDRPSYYLYPNPDGQRLVAQEIFASILAHLDGKLSEAERRVSRELRQGAQR